MSTVDEISALPTTDKDISNVIESLSSQGDSFLMDDYIPEDDDKKSKGRGKGTKKSRSTMRLYDCNVMMTFALPLKTKIAAFNKEEAVSSLKRFCATAKEQNGFRNLDTVFTANKSKLSILDLKSGDVHFLSEIPMSVENSL